jgi:hypothetical protein
MNQRKNGEQRGSKTTSLIAKIWLVIMVAILAAGARLPATAGICTDTETAAGNQLQGWSDSLWTQTSRADFEAGVRSGVDTATNPGNVQLALKSDWYQTAWSRRAPVTINNTGAALTAFQVKVTLTYDSDMKSDFSDIRFTDSNGTTLLPYWRESYTAASSAIFWVKVPSVPRGTKTIYVYYGNPSVSTASDGTATFEFFDDFSKDLSKWTIHTGGKISINTSYGNPAPCLEINGGSTSGYPYGLGIIGTDKSFNNFLDGIIEADIFPDKNGLPEIIFRGNYKQNTGYKGRWDTRDDWESPFFMPPYAYWEQFGDDVERFGMIGQWQKAKLVITHDTYEIYSNDKLMASARDDEYLDSGEIGLANHYGNFSRFDNVRVRKYASPEPSTTTGVEEGPYQTSGTIASRVLDTGIPEAIFDFLFWDKTLGAGTNISLAARASDTMFNAGDATPPWHDMGTVSPVISGLPAGRYLQWRATLTTTNTANTPILSEARAYYH